MKASFSLSLVGVALLASTAQAQLPASWRYGDSFELDNYVTEKREQQGYAPSSSFANNSNIRAVGGGCYYVPARLNVVKGESILSTERKSVIYKLLSSLGQSHSHSAMARSSQTIRHNTMIDSRVRVASSFEPIPRLVASSIRDGDPGMTTHSVEAALTLREINLIDGFVLGAGGTAVEQIARAAELQRADAEMNDFRGWYRLYAYTNMAWNDPYKTSTNDGNMCSGSILHAHVLAGNRGWSWDQRRSYPQDVRQPAAGLLYEEIRDTAFDEIAGLKAAVLDINEVLGGAGQGEVARAVANQIVNCMAFNDCGNLTKRWQNGVGSGRSVSPDDLHMLAFVAAYNAAIAGKANMFVYNSAKPLQRTGDYFCCVRGALEPQNNLPYAPLVQYRYTQCLMPGG
jgi:hypothetical protein